MQGQSGTRDTAGGFPSNSLGQGPATRLSVCPSAPIRLPILVPGVKPSSTHLADLKVWGEAEERSVQAGLCFHPAFPWRDASPQRIAKTFFYINSLDLKPRKNMLGVMGSKFPVFSALSPQFRGAGPPRAPPKGWLEAEQPGLLGLDHSPAPCPANQPSPGQGQGSVPLCRGDSLFPPGRLMGGGSMTSVGAPKVIFFC